MDLNNDKIRQRRPSTQTLASIHTFKQTLSRIGGGDQEENPYDTIDDRPGTPLERIASRPVFSFPTADLTGAYALQAIADDSKQVEDEHIDLEKGEQGAESPALGAIPELPSQEEPASVPLSKGRKRVLLAVFSFAQFVDVVAGTGALVALADIEKALGMSVAQGTWVVNAYSIAFAACLLLAGRLSDLFQAKVIFISGFAILGTFAIACGVSTNPIMLIVFRGCQGLGAALTIPSALNSIMNSFPEKQEQASALAVFSMSGALGAVLGLLVAGVLLLINWHWCFLFIGVIAIPLSGVCLFLIPTPPKRDGKRGKLDFPGLFLLTGALILLVFAMTSGSTDNKWDVPIVLAPLIISIVVMLPAFFWWETKVDPNDALVPPELWKLPNFAVLFGVAISIYGWFNSFFVPTTVVWQSYYGISSIGTAIRFVPLGVTGAFLNIHASFQPHLYKPKYALAPAMLLCAAGSALFAFADGPDKFWKFVLPGEILGCLGGTMGYVTCNIGMLQSGGPKRAGVVGAIFNSALQVGAAVIVAVTTSISSTIQEDHPAPSYVPYKWSFIFMVGLMVVEAVACLVFYREPPSDGEEVKIVIH